MRMKKQNFCGKPGPKKWLMSANQRRRFCLRVFRWWVVWANAVKPLPAPQIFKTHFSPPLVFIFLHFLFSTISNTVGALFAPKNVKNRAKKGLRKKNGHLVQKMGHSRISLRTHWCPIKFKKVSFFAFSDEQKPCNKKGPCKKGVQKRGPLL